MPIRNNYAFLRFKISLKKKSYSSHHFNPKCTALSFGFGSPGDTLNTNDVIKTIGNVDYKIN